MSSNTIQTGTEIARSCESAAVPCCAYFVRMFKPQFAGLVARGEKLQTVRPTPKRMPKIGDRISLRCWNGKPYRSKQHVLREAEIIEVLPLEIQYDYSVHLDGRKLTSSECSAFAIADGFGSPTELYNWFEETHGLPFHGVLIRWTNAKAQPTTPPLHDHE